MMETQERLMFQIAVGTLATVILTLFGYMIRDHGECKKDRLALRRLFEKTLGDMAFIKGQLAIYKSVFRKLKISLPEQAEGEESEG